MKTKTFTLARDYPVWIIPDNPVYNIPVDCSEVHFEADLSGPFSSVRTLRALAIEYHPGKVFTHVYLHGVNYPDYHPTIKVPGVCSIEDCAQALGIPSEEIPQVIRDVSVWPAEPSDTATIYGVRTLLNCRESGYAHEGYVSVNGRKRRAFTSSELMQRPEGKLCSVAVLHVCSEKVPDVS